MSRGGICATLLLLVLASCNSYDPVERARRALSITANADSMGTLPLSVSELAMREPRELVESSAAVMSSAFPDVVFTINDSNNEPELFAMDTVGNFRGRWRIAGAANRDWEAASSGPCTGDTAALVTPANVMSRRCLYLGDVGDNNAQRESVQLYQIREPVQMDTSASGALTSKQLVVRYPDHPHDVEAMYLGPDATVYLITKRPALNASGMLRQALVFAISPASWVSADTVVAHLTDSLPIIPGSSRLRSITDATLSADARWLAVRTYGQVYTFATDSLNGRVIHDIAPAICNIESVEAIHGEGISWIAGTPNLLLTSEGRNAPMHRISCPLPTR